MSPVTRRTVLRAGAAAVAAPWIVRDAFATSGELNFMGWSGFDLKQVFINFAAKTGIKVNFAAQSDNNMIFAQARLAAQAGGIDCLEPTLDVLPAYLTADLVRPWDLVRIGLGNYEPALVTGEVGKRMLINGKRWLMPSVWNAETLVFDTAQNPQVYGTASLADLFDPKNQGKVTVRPHSALAALGRVLDAQGKLPMPFLDGYKNDDNMRKVWDVILAEAISAKQNFARFWSLEPEAEAAFASGGCTLGLCWQQTGSNLLAGGAPVAAVAPKEGAFAGTQGFVLMRNAKNTDQAHAWVKYIASPEGGAAYAKAFAANPAAKGAVDKMDPAFAAFFKAAYPEGALAQLWWWPAQSGSFLKLRSDYAAKLVEAWKEKA
ncbi:MAG TPA: extracellular solute-binding protein [Dongiaceae bacterium]|nr:extracellular solute-binding protein [Dongiaceae bacterium]